MLERKKCHRDCRCKQLHVPWNLRLQFFFLAIKEWVGTVGSINKNVCLGKDADRVLFR